LHQPGAERAARQTDWRSRRELVVVDTGADAGVGAVTSDAGGADADPAAPPLARLACPGEGSWVLLDVLGDRVLAARSSPASAPSAHLLTVAPGAPRT
jgi:hypothetical protein